MTSDKRVKEKTWNRFSVTMAKVKQTFVKVFAEEEGFQRVLWPIYPRVAEEAKVPNKKLHQEKKSLPAFLCARQDFIPVGWPRKCQLCQTGSLEQRSSCTVSHLQNSAQARVCVCLCVCVFLATSLGRARRRGRSRWSPTRSQEPLTYSACLKAEIFFSFITLLPSCSTWGFCESRHKLPPRLPLLPHLSNSRQITWRQDPQQQASANQCEVAGGTAIMISCLFICERLLHWRTQSTEFSVNWQPFPLEFTVSLTTNIQQVANNSGGMCLLSMWVFLFRWVNLFERLTHDI